MNYKNHYNLLMERGRNRPVPSEDCEKHHILPKSLGGSNEPENMVYLTYREHYLAHWLLFKIMDNTETKHKMACAFYLMSKSNNGSRLTNSRKYERARIIFVNTAKEFNKTELGMSKKIAQSLKRLETMKDRFVFDFYHEEFGEFKATCTYDLMYMFPDQKLNSSNLVKVGNGVRPSHKGWMLLSNRHLGVVGLLSIKHQKMSESAIKKFIEIPQYLDLLSKAGKKGGKAQKGYKKHYHENGDFKMAKPGTDKSNNLIAEGYYLK